MAETNEQETHQGAIDFLFQKKSEGKITSELQKDPMVFEMVADLLDKLHRADLSIEKFEHKVTALHDELDDSSREKELAEEEAVDLLNELKGVGIMNPDNMQEEMKLKIMRKFMRDLSLEQVENVEFAVATLYKNYNKDLEV